MDNLEKYFNRALRLCALAAFAILTTGCSVYMAATQPGKKDLGVLSAGTPRQAVMAELGAPIDTREAGPGKVDIYKFTQGYHGVWKGARAVGHGAADVLTLGLWEVVGTPIEGVANGTEMTIEVTYDQSDRVVATNAIQGAHKMPVTAAAQ
jgi:hypothetical protein